MATKLEKPISRLIEVDGKEIEATLSPEEGGQLIFRPKGARGEKSRQRHSLEDLYAGKQAGMFAAVPPTESLDDQAGNPDLIDMGQLEALLMIDGDELMTPGVKGRVWRIIRDARDRRREDAGLPPVVGDRHREEGEKE